jgi:hypothetical protein
MAPQDDDERGDADDQRIDAGVSHRIDRKGGNGEQGRDRWPEQPAHHQGPPAPQPVEREDAQRAQGELPGAIRHQIEGADRRRLDLPQAEQQRNRQDRGGPRRPEAKRREEHQRRHDEIVLLLDRQRPDVQQRLELRRAGEIVGLLEQHDVRREGHGADELFGKIRKLGAGQEKGAIRAVTTKVV